ncbi:MAG: LysM peptidoglycan-binding domain-containing protein [Desulforhopalus sp.]
MSFIYPPVCRTIYVLYILWLLVTTVFFSQVSFAGNTNFPRYEALADNIEFWEKIYSHYSLTEAVIHDSEDLSKIYEVIPVLGDDLPGAARLNSIFQKQARKKYSTILKKLAGQPPSTRDEIRVDALFSGKNKRKEMDRAAENVRSQRGQKERFQSGVIHSGRYIDEIKKIFRSYRLPEELAYLPHVESSFNYKAYSKFGAAGIWQFTRPTGKQYLTIDYTLDERLDPIIASHAAAKYLKKSYSALNNWPLALTSYNYGLAGMLRAVNEEGDYVKVFKNYNKGHFKFASKNFYSEFLAALKVARDLENNQSIKLDSAKPSHYLPLPGYVHITEVVQHFGISKETVKSLNPALRLPIVNGEKRIPKGYILRLPPGKKTDRLVGSIPSSFYRNEQKPSLFHRVNKGDTASSIARQHGVSLKSLMKANNLDKYATIFLKQKLRIPQRSEKLVERKKGVPKLSAQQNTKMPPPGHVPQKPVLLASKKLRPSGDGYDFLPKKDPTVYNVFKIHQKNSKTYGYITVQPEESLGLYGNWLGTKSSVLSTLNGLKHETDITPGQKLLLVFDRLSPDLFEEKRLDFLQETEEDFFSAFTIIGQKMYQVISGDTLWDLCYNKFDIPLWLLERYNSTINLTSLNKEQELIIPIVQQI